MGTTLADCVRYMKRVEELEAYTKEFEGYVDAWRAGEINFTDLVVRINELRSRSPLENNGETNE